MVLPLLATLLAAAAAPAPATAAPAARLSGDSQFNYVRERQPGGADAERVETVTTTFTLSEAQRRVVRVRASSRSTLGQKEAVERVEIAAWPVEATSGAPSYAFAQDGCSAAAVRGSDLLVLTCGDEETPGWRVYDVAKGTHLFDTSVPVVAWKPRLAERVYSHERYAGLQFAADDEKDPALLTPGAVAQVTLADPRGGLRRYLLLDDDHERAVLLRSAWDCERALTLSTDAPPGAPLVPQLVIRFSPTEDEPGVPELTLSAPVLADDQLDLAHAELPTGLHLVPRS